MIPMRASPLKWVAYGLVIGVFLHFAFVEPGETPEVPGQYIDILIAGFQGAFWGGVAAWVRNRFVK